MKTALALAISHFKLLTRHNLNVDYRDFLQYKAGYYVQNVPNGASWERGTWRARFENVSVVLSQLPICLRERADEKSIQRCRDPVPFRRSRLLDVEKCRAMINTNQNLLFIATILALCVISFVHVFLFPLYNVDTKHGLSKTFLDFEQSLCTTNFKHRKHWRRIQCPQYGIVTIMQGGRLGNQMWEYASVWALSRRTGLEPYVPRCIRSKLDQVK